MLSFLSLYLPLPTRISSQQRSLLIMRFLCSFFVFLVYFSHGPDIKFRYTAHVIDGYLMLIALYFLKSNVSSDVRFRDRLTAAFTVGFAESIINSRNFDSISDLNAITDASLKLSIIKFLSFSFILLQIFNCFFKLCSNRMTAICET